MKFASLTERVKGEAADAWDLHYAAKQAKSRGEDVIVLSVGDPDFATPDGVVDAALAAIRAGDTHYTTIAGHRGLRAAIAARQQRLAGRPVDPDHVIVTSGAQNALFACALCLLDHGDEAIVLQPMYVTYEATVRAPGATLVPVVLDAADGFRLRRDVLEAAITERSRAIFYASPSNPTGIALAADELDYVAELAVEHDLWVVADEVYADFVFAGDFVPAASRAALDGRLITIGSMSKAYAMSGWRVGWAIAPDAMIENMDKLALCMLYGLPGFVQQAAQYALEHCQADLEAMRDAYRRRLVTMHAAFAAMGLEPLMPEAGMFMLVDVRATGFAVPEFARRLYDATGVSVLDATAFGPSAAGHVRVSATVGDVELDDALARIRGFVEGLA